jgi:aspartate/methionine/tyrosine aminotransferase
VRRFKVIDAITAAMQDDNTHQYQSYRNLPELRQGMDFYENNYGVTLNSVTEVLPFMGSKETLCILAFLNEGDEVLIPNQVTQLIARLQI